MKTKLQATVVHEITGTQHRIVILNSDSTNDAGDWSPLHELAVHKQLFAVVGESKLPQGVFTCRPVTAQVLA